jgi:hypothetical protein
MIKKTNHFSFSLLIVLLLNADAKACSSLKLKISTHSLKAASIGSAIAVSTFVGYHEASYHKNLDQIKKYYSMHVINAPSEHYALDNFYLASYPFMRKALKHHQYAFVTRGLTKMGLSKDQKPNVAIY